MSTYTPRPSLCGLPSLKMEVIERNIFWVFSFFDEFFDEFFWWIFRQMFQEINFSTRHFFRHFFWRMFWQISTFDLVLIITWIFHKYFWKIQGHENWECYFRIQLSPLLWYAAKSKQSLTCLLFRKGCASHLTFTKAKLGKI